MLWVVGSGKSVVRFSPRRAFGFYTPTAYVKTSCRGRVLLSGPKTHLFEDRKYGSLFWTRDLFCWYFEWAKYFKIGEWLIVFPFQTNLTREKLSRFQMFILLWLLAGHYSQTQAVPQNTPAFAEFFCRTLHTVKILMNFSLFYAHWST